jgi:hypothetical protein
MRHSRRKSFSCNHVGMWWSHSDNSNRKSVSFRSDL